MVGPIFGVFWVDEPQHDASDVQITPDAQDLFDLKVCDEYPDIPCVVSYVNHLAVSLNSSIFGGKLLSGVSPLFFVDCNLLRFVVLRWSNFEMLIRQSLPQLLLLLSSIGRYASDKFLFTFKALHPLPLSLSNSTPSASSLLRFDIYVYEYFSEVDVRARFAYITYCFKVTTPIRSHKKTLF